YSKSDFIPSRLRLTSQRSQTHQRGHRPERTGSESSGTHISGRNIAPQRQPTADGKVDNQQAEKHALAQTARVERQAGQQDDPHNVGRGGPEVMRPFVLVAGNVAKGYPREVSAAKKTGHAPQRRAAHEVTGTGGLLRPVLFPDLGPGVNLRVFYLP